LFVPKAAPDASPLACQRCERLCDFGLPIFVKRHQEQAHMKALIKESAPGKLALSVRSVVEWAKRDYAWPSPHFIKQRCLIRNGIANATWVETGTYWGATTRLLSRQSKMVYSIEPEPTLYANAKKRLEGIQNIELILGPSENELPRLLPRLSGDVNFWLDGHFSAGDTYDGKHSTPIIQELAAISSHLDQLGRVTILVDDVHCFDPRPNNALGYPSIDVLVDWARAHQCYWTIEHNIFVAKNY
jgi:hypothetical protein